MMWIGFKPFKITNIKQESEDIKSFTVETEEYDFSEFTPGQYITVDVSSDKLPYRAKRHYSIVSGDKNHLTFGVKRMSQQNMKAKFQQYYTTRLKKAI